MVKEKERICECCNVNEPAAFFHSRCCNAHFEGVILENKEMAIVCEECRKFVAMIQPKLNNKEANKNE